MAQSERLEDGAVVQGLISSPYHVMCLHLVLNFDHDALEKKQVKSRAAKCYYMTQYSTVRSSQILLTGLVTFGQKRIRVLPVTGRY